MNLKDQIYAYDRRIEGALRKIRESIIDDDSRKRIFEFYQECLAQGYSKARIIKYLDTLERIARFLGKPFIDANRNDVADFIRKIEGKDYSEWTVHDYKVILKKFYKWLRNSEDYPLEVRWIKVSSNIPSRLQKKDLLTTEDVQRIANCAINVRDKAFIWVYFESMRRLGEILSLRVGSVEFDNLGARLFVQGKMGSDNARVITSAPLLATWLNIHPLRDEPNAPVWVTLNRRREHKPITYSTVRSMITDCVQRAGINKKVWPYLIRHSRITPASKVLSYSLLCSTAGWKQGSKMPSIYIHLAGEDVDEAQCILNGIAKVERKEEQLKPKVCCRCDMKNIPDSKFCNKCGFPLDYETAIKMDETRAKVDRLMSELVKEPKILDVLIEGLEKMKRG